MQKDVGAAVDDGGVGAAVAVSRLFFSNGFCGTADDEWLAEALVFCPIMADALI